MAMDAIAHTDNGSFLYSGCYRVRGELTSADRAAWGLHEPFANQLDRHAAPLSRIASRPAPREQRTTGQTRAAIRSSQRDDNRLRQTGDRAKRLLVTCVAAVMQGRVRRFIARHGADYARSTRRWRRLAVVAAGVPATCLLWGGRAFVTGAAAKVREGCA
jgi:hypothetical protein